MHWSYTAYFDVRHAELREGFMRLKDTTLTHPDASIHIHEDCGKHTISVESRNGLFTPVKKWVTDYSLDLIEDILRVKGPAYLCDEIMRDESPLYIQHSFHWDILSYVGKEEFAGRSVLDFGSGSGASSMVLARMFPEAKIVGVELVPELVELARHRARFYCVEGRVSFQRSPNANNLPKDIGEFDYIVFSAVYEHLFPNEREVILPLIWSHLKPGGVLFLDQTPYRWFPIEMHTTGLPLINYLPDFLALYFARRFSKRVSPTATWSELLRKGVRGGTTEEIMSNLNRQGNNAELLNPSQLGVKDHIDLWYHLSSTTRKPLTKKIMMWLFRAIKAVTGVTMIPSLSLAIRKRVDSECARTHI
jgi:2-polyprenyl-3-methyl-5-hydroxy-6-metoxy-1,4-benzoquinol methylase